MRQMFTSRLTTVLTMVGVAVGLGNVWRFPYMMGSFGGSAFLVVYLAFVVLFAVPALMGEWALGRETRHGPLGALAAAFGPRGRWLGVVLLVTVGVANSYYLVVIANVVYTAAFSVARGFGAEAMPAYAAGLNDGVTQAAIGIAIIASAMAVLYLGLHRGIERISKVFVPFFGVVVAYLIVSSLRLPGALDALARFVRPDFASLTGTSVFAAMGQAFFSLSLGGTFYLIYGSYLREEERLPGAAVLTAMGDVGAAVLAALFIVPTTLAFGIDLETGPRLVFVTLPSLFQAIPGGRVLGTAFLVALAMVAYLSTVAAFQVLFGTAVDTLKLPVARSLLAIGIAEAALMVPTALKPEVIGTLDLIFGSGMQILGSGIALAALTWGLGRATTIRQVFGGRGGRWPAIYYAWIRWGVPVALLVTLALYVRDNV